MKGELIIGIGSKPMGKKPMGKMDDSEESEEESSEFEMALDEAVDALMSKDKDTAKEALKAAITAHCADLYSEMEK